MFGLGNGGGPAKPLLRTAAHSSKIANEILILLFVPFVDAILSLLSVL
jgi:hypothetical protein